jgi:hypothetical protein
MNIYNSVIKDAPNSAMDFNEIDFKNFKLQSQQKSNRGLSAGGGGQNTMMATRTAAAAAARSNTTRITFSVYDSINL